MSLLRKSYLNIFSTKVLLSISPVYILMNTISVRCDFLMHIPCRREAMLRKKHDERDASQEFMCMNVVLSHKICK